ncbi:unnamed protein product [Calypogeia fissa]
MGNLEDITRLVTTVMGVIKKQERAERRDRDQASSIARCLQVTLSSKGKFDGRDVTKFLEEYSTQVEVHMVDEEVAIWKFAMVVESALRETVELIIEKTANEESWKVFEQRMKEEFMLEDLDRETYSSFLDWVNERDKMLGPRELLREFTKKMRQLPLRDAKVIGLQKFDLFLRAAGEQLRDELETALDILNRDWVEELDDWSLIDKAVKTVHERRRRREINREVTKGVVGRKRYLGREGEGQVRVGMMDYEPRVHTFG